MTNIEAKATIEVYQEEILNTLWLTNEQRKALHEALDRAIKALDRIDGLDAIYDDMLLDYWGS